MLHCLVKKNVPPVFDLVADLIKLILSHHFKHSDGVMENSSNFITALIKAHAKPILKEALHEFLIENNFSLVSTIAPNPSKLLSTSEVAEMIGSNRHRVYEMIGEGLPYIEEKPFKFRLEDINSFIAKNVKSKRN